MSSPMISVIIPTYNYARFLPAALDSIRMQTFMDWECIVVDDGSTDETRLVVHDYFRKHVDKRFRYVHIENSGTSVAKNTGIDLALGTHVQFLDADDLLATEKLSIQYAMMESRDCALVFSRTVFFDEANSQKEFPGPYPKGFLAASTLKDEGLLAALIKNNILTISSPLVHKELLVQAGKFPPALKNNEDWLLWFKVALLKPIFIFDRDERSATKIRIHSSSAMRSNHKMYLGEIVVRKAMDDALQLLKGCLHMQALRAENMNLLALHQVRSVDWLWGWKTILKRCFQNPAQGPALISKGLSKSFARMVRYIIPQNGA
jgi:glycosyltransferase involved in cell wall biosynthesis